MKSTTLIRLSTLLALAIPLCAAAQQKPAKLQYKHESINISAATKDEPIAAKLSIEKASAYLEEGAKAWVGQRNCISCHTTGAYLRYRPALTPHLGKPSADMRDFFVREMEKLKKMDRENFQKGVRTAQAVYVAAGLAEWDAHVTGKLSPETDQALQLIFEVQQDNGAWQSTDCWPPYESSAYQEASVAIMAAATAPGWLKSKSGVALKAQIDKANAYLRDTPAPHDYAKVLKLWAATRVPGIAAQAERKELIEKIWSLQQDDGGWSMRSFAEPEQWGSGNRAGKLRAEPEFKNPPSDGHMTGLATLVLRDASVAAKDPRIQKAVTWLKSNQRESGRWWTRSLNNDKFHFITYSGTAYPLLALMKCGELPNAPRRVAVR
jgi:squalene-hopene/tetraprenyl-beta-curcumene cyclase